MKNILIVALVLIGVIIISPDKTLAATATLSASETTANVTEVVEVKAARTLTVGSLVASSTAGTDPSQITIGTCVVTFATTTSGTAKVGAATLTADEPNCSDNAATILLATSSVATDVALTVSQTAQELRGLRNVIDTNHGALAITGSGGDITLTGTSTVTSATNITLSTTTGNAISNSVVAGTPTTGVIPVTPVAQVVTFTPTLGQGYTYTTIINSTNTYESTYLKGSLQELVEALNALLTANSAITCTEDDTVITCTADSVGTAFTYSASVTAPTPSSSSSNESGRRSSGGGGGGGAAPSKVVVTDSSVLNANRIQAIKMQINNLLALIERLRAKLMRMRGY